MPSLSLDDSLKKEMDDIKGFHSISPQYRYYSNQYVNKLNALLYRGLISKDYYSFLYTGIRSKRDTKVLHTFAGLEELLKAYRPKLGELDLLYNSNISTIKVLKSLSEGICECLEGWNIYLASLDDRLNHIIDFLNLSDSKKDSKDKLCYYYLGIVKDALFMAGKIHPNKYLYELTECYKIIYEYVINRDLEFYMVYQDSYLSESVEDGFSKYSDEDLIRLNVLDRNTLRFDSKLHTSSSFSNASDGYNYSDFLKDKCNVFCNLVTRTSTGKSLEDVNDSILGSMLPDNLKRGCSNELYAMRTSFIESLTSVTTSYYWYNELQCDFIYHCTPQDIEEGYLVADCICKMLTEDSLVDFAVYQASLVSLANAGDKSSYNLSLYEYLYKLQEYGMIDSYKDAYNKLKEKI